MLTFLPRQLVPLARPMRLARHLHASGALALRARVPPLPVASAPLESRTILTTQSLAAPLLSHPFLVVQRQIEMLQIFVGFEQANRYALHAPSGDVVGFVIEEGNSFVSMLKRQLFRTHRPFSATVLDADGTPVLSINRPFYFLNSQIIVKDVASNAIIGEVHQHWHLWRRRYDLFLGDQQFARSDEGFLALQFAARNEEGTPIARVEKNWTGFGREIFTDARQYAIRFDDTELQAEQPEGQPVLTFDERAIVAAMAVSIDFDYFSLHGSGGGLFPLLFFLGE